MNIILSDGPSRSNLLPFTYTRPVGCIRVGILTIGEKYEKHGHRVSYQTESYLAQKFPKETAADNFIIDASILPDVSFFEALEQLKIGESLMQDEIWLATRTDGKSIGTTKIHYEGALSKVDQIWKIFSHNEQEIKKDFELLTNGRTSAGNTEHSLLIHPENIFIEEGAKVLPCILNAENGPIYIAKDAEVMEGSMIRGPFALGEHSQVKMGAKIYGATTIGPHCKVGGEVNNSVFFGYSNKAHDGFVGNSVIGEWCNIGADSNNSNLKNNYEEVKVWNYQTKSFAKTGLTFCGLFMGDHSKCGINTMFNTGTVVGVSANVFGGGFPRNFIPSYSWGGASGFSTYQLNKAFDTVEKVMERRHIEFDEVEKSILSNIFEQTKEERNF